MPAAGRSSGLPASTVVPPPPSLGAPPGGTAPTQPPINVNPAVRNVERIER
jgi:hypothetical protein